MAGGGIAGCAVAVELALPGAVVTLMEKNQPGVGATGASAGMLAPQHESHGPDAAFHFGVACKEAYPAFVERLQELAGWEVGFRTDGMLVVNGTEEEEEGARRELAFQEAVGREGEILSTAEALGIHGAVSRDVLSWLWLPNESQVDTQRLAVALADAVQGAGVRLVQGRDVTAVTSRGHQTTGVRLQLAWVPSSRHRCRVQGMPRSTRISAPAFVSTTCECTRRPLRPTTATVQLDA